MTRQAAPPAPQPFVDELPTYSTAPAGDVPVVHRASSNESPLPPPATVLRAAADAVAQGHLYPALLGTDLIATLAAAHGVDPERVAVGDGSLSVLAHLLGAFVAPGAEVVFGWRSYEAYPMLVLAAGGRPHPVALDADHGIDLDAIGRAVTPQTAAVVLCTPNNPTGTALSGARLEAFLDAVPAGVLVVLDEAYTDFVAPGDLDPVDGIALALERPNVVALRTFSKVWSLAGLRVGYLVAHPDVAEAVRRVSPPFPVSAPAAAAAAAALGEPDHRSAVLLAVHEGRAAVLEVLRRQGLPAVGEHANFVWLPLGDASTAYATHARAHGITVRAFGGEGVRITVGDPGLAGALAGLTACECP